MPQVAVTGDDSIALALQSFSCFVELIPVAGTCADCFSNDCGIIRTESVLCDGTTINESTAGCLVAQSNDLAVLGTGADINRVLCDVCSSDVSSDINAQIFVRCCKLSCVALRVLQDECSFCCVQVGSVSAACCQSLVQSGLVQLVSSSDDGGLDLVLCCEVRIQFQILLDHAGNFVGEGPDVQSGLIGVQRSCSFSGCCFGCSRSCLGCGRCGATSTCGHGQNHYQCQEQCE